MKAQPVIETKALIRLRDEYERMARRIKTTDGPLDKRVLEMQARTLSACALDLDDLITGREHPSGRRS